MGAMRSVPWLSHLWTAWCPWGCRAVAHQGAVHRAGCSPCFGRGFGTDVGRAGWSCEEVHAGRSLVLLRIPSQLHAATQEFVAWTTSTCPRWRWLMLGGLCHAHLAALPASGPHAGSRTSWLQTGCCWSTGLLLQKLHWAVLRAAKPPRAVNLGSFLLVCQQAGMFRREAAHFQGLCEQEGQLLEFEAASSTKFVLAVLSLPGQGRGTSWQSAFLLQYV